MSAKAITADMDRRTRADEVYVGALRNLNALVAIIQTLSADTPNVTEQIARSVTLRDDLDEATRELGLIVRNLAGIPETERVVR